MKMSREPFATGPVSWGTQAETTLSLRNRKRMRKSAGEKKSRKRELIKIDDILEIIGKNKSKIPFPGEKNILVYQSEFYVRSYIATEADSDD